MTLAAASILGFFLGVRHATDADHVVAITTIVCREPTPRNAMKVGVFWGIGHTLTILAVGGAIIMFGLVVPPGAALMMELAVAAMLIALGGLNVISAIRRRSRSTHPHGHAHASHACDGDDTSALPVVASVRLAHGRRFMRTTLRPLAIGVVHGLAGSAAIALLVLTTIRDTLRAMLYLLVFGGGTVLGMMLLTTAMTVPIGFASRRIGSLDRIMAAVTGAVSLAFGLFLVYQHGLGASSLFDLRAGSNP